MTYPQQPGGWSDPSWSDNQPDWQQPGAAGPAVGSPAAGSPGAAPGSPGGGYQDPTNAYPANAYPASAYPANAYPSNAYPGNGYPAGSYQAGSYQASGYPATGYPAAGVPGPAPVYPGYGYAPAPQPPMNGMAIAALVVSCVGVLGLCAYGLGGFIGAIGAILGHVSRRQINERAERGAGMALAGVIVGWCATALFTLAAAAWVIFIVYVAKHPESFDNTSDLLSALTGLIAHLR